MNQWISGSKFLVYMKPSSLIYNLKIESSVMAEILSLILVPTEKKTLENREVADDLVSFWFILV